MVFFFPNVFYILLCKLNVLRLVNRTALAVLALLRHKVRTRQFVVVFSIDRIVVPNFGIAAHHQVIFQLFNLFGKFFLQFSERLLFCQGLDNIICKASNLEGQKTIKVEIVHQALDFERFEMRLVLCHVIAETFHDRFKLLNLEILSVILLLDFFLNLLGPSVLFVALHRSFLSNLNSIIQIITNF